MHRLIQMSLFQLYYMLVSGKEGPNQVIHSMVVNVQSICCLLLFLAIVQCQREETVAVCGFPGIPAGAEIVGWNGRIRVDTIFQQNDVVEYRCRDGFRNFDTSTTTRMCQKDGTWLGEAIQCQEQLYCKTPYGAVRNGFSIYQCSFNRTVSISFIEFESDGFSPEVSIQKDREREVICHHFSLSSSVRKKYKVLQRCNNVPTTYIEFTYPQSTANEFSIFSSTRKCDDYPSVPANGIVSTKTDVGVEYRCKPGYQLHGNTFRRCNTQSGLWLPSLPQCRPELKTPPIQDVSTTTVKASVQHTSSPRIRGTLTSRYSGTSTPTSSSTITRTTSPRKEHGGKNTSESEKGIANNRCQHQDELREDMKRTKIAILSLTFVMFTLFIGLATFCYYTEERKKKNLHRTRPFDEPFYENTVH